MSHDDGFDPTQLERDRQVVALLIDTGDPLTRARPVDHFVYFPGREARDRFVADVAALGFQVTCKNDRGHAPNRWLALVTRVDRVDLRSVNAVVRTLIAAAKRRGGHHDGWACQVLRE